MFILNGNKFIINKVILSDTTNNFVIEKKWLLCEIVACDSVPHRIYFFESFSTLNERMASSPKALRTVTLIVSSFSNRSLISAPFFCY